MAYLVKAPRVGRSQGAVIFWGLVSAFFASAFCYYYLENRNNEEKNRTLFEQVMVLQGERDSLSADRDKMQAATSTTEKQLNERQQFLQEKETKLAEEESALEAAGTQNQSQSQQSAAQAAGVKKFDDTVRKLVAKVPDADVVVRGGRPVLRMPSSVFFDPGDTQLKADGKTVLTQVAQVVGGGPARFELRVETFTDSDAETPGPGSGPPPENPPADKKADSWTLTGERASAIAHFLRDASAISFQNVVAMGRGDSKPIEPNSPQGHARNRRVEITITPVPATFRAPEPAKAKSSTKGKTPSVIPAPAPDTSASTGSP